MSIHLILAYVMSKLPTFFLFDRQIDKDLHLMANPTMEEGEQVRFYSTLETGFANPYREMLE